MRIEEKIYLVLNAHTVQGASKIVAATFDLKEAVRIHNEEDSTRCIVEYYMEYCNEVKICKHCGRPMKGEKDV